MTVSCSSMSERFCSNASLVVSSRLGRGGASSFRFIRPILGAVRSLVQYYRPVVP